MNMVEIICNLEMIFPLLFFNLMEHLPIHLLYEVKVGCLVEYRWMYPFKMLDITDEMYINVFSFFFLIENIYLILCRYLFNLKKKVKEQGTC